MDDLTLRILIMFLILTTLVLMLKFKFGKHSDLILTVYCMSLIVYLVIILMAYGNGLVEESNNNKLEVYKSLEDYYNLPLTELEVSRIKDTNLYEVYISGEEKQVVKFNKETGKLTSFEIKDTTSN